MCCWRKNCCQRSTALLGTCCLPQRQCTSTSRSWHSRAFAPWDTPFHQSWHVASQHCDLNPVNYCIWGMTQEHVYQVPSTRQRLVDSWAEFQQSVLDSRIKQWQKILETCMVVTLNSCCDVACLTLSATHPDLFTATKHNSPFQRHQCSTGNNITFHQTNDLCISQDSVVRFFRCDGQVHNHGYSLFYSKRT